MSSTSARNAADTIYNNIPSKLIEDNRNKFIAINLTTGKYIFAPSFSDVLFRTDEIWEEGSELYVRKVNEEGGVVLNTFVQA